MLKAYLFMFIRRICYRILFQKFTIAWPFVIRWAFPALMLSKAKGALSSSCMWERVFFLCEEMFAVLRTWYKKDWIRNFDAVRIESNRQGTPKRYHVIRLQYTYNKFKNRRLYMYPTDLLGYNSTTYNNLGLKNLSMTVVIPTGEH